MLCLCLKDQLLNTFDCNKHILNLSLMSCSWCKSLQNNKDFEVNDDNKYQMMFIHTLFFSFKQSEEIILRQMDILILEKIQNKFKFDKKCEKTIENLIKIILKYNKIDEIKLQKFLKEISEYTFIELIKRFIFNKDFLIAQLIIVNYFYLNVEILESSFRNRLYFRVKKSDEIKTMTISISDFDVKANYQYYKSKPFFDIGWSLDEGCTEFLTQQDMKAIVENLKIFDKDYKNYFENRYFFEVKFFKKFISIFDKLNVETRKQILNKISYNDHISINLILKLTNYTNDKCNFFNFYYYTDNQKWKEAHLLLNSILSSNIELDILLKGVM